MPAPAELPPASVALPERAAVPRRFDRAAASFDAACAAHDYAREVLLGRLGWFDLAPQLIVDAGCATGRGTRALAARYPHARVIGVDCSAGMLAAAQAADAGGEYLRGDVHALPFEAASVDLLFANLLLPWCDPRDALTEMARVLAPGGLLLLSTTGPKTLEQVRRAWRSVDDLIHVHAGVDLQTLGDLLARAGVREPVLDIDCLRLRFSGTASLHAELRATGAVNGAGARRRTLTGARRFAAYERALSGPAADGIEISVELAFAQAWGGQAPEPAGSTFRGIPVRRA